MKRALTAALAAALAISLTPSPPAAAVFNDQVQFLGEVVPNLDLTEHSSGAGLGGRFYFAGELAKTGHGSELWVTDGSPAGTREVKDIFPGDDDGGPRSFTVFKGRVWFAATDQFGEELWVSDGTSAGTRRIRDISPGMGSSEPHEFVVAGSHLYFGAKNAAGGEELWRTDGTANGTQQVTDIWPGASSSAPRSITRFGSGVVFSAAPQAEVRKPYFSNGATTYRLDNAGTVDLNPGDFEVLGSKVYFQARDDGTFGYELWHSRGGRGDALILKDIAPGALDSYPHELTALGDRIVFAANEPTAGNELWATNGTTAGTVRIKDIWGGGGSSYPEYLLRVGDRIYFNADDDDNTGDELWVTQGTSQTTRLVVDVRPGEDDSGAYPLGAAGGRLLFGAYTEDVGYEPYVTNATATGARLLGDLYPGTGDSDPLTLGRVGGTVFLRVDRSGTSQLASYTLPVPAVRARLRSSYPRADARKRRIRIPIVVKAPEITVSGRVALYKGTRRIGVASLNDGIARVRITVRLAPGRHRVRAEFRGSLDAQARTSHPFVVRVRR